MSYKLVWVGPRESDISDCGIDFHRSVTFYGSNIAKNRAFTSETQVRINHLNKKYREEISSFRKKELSQLLADPDIRFMFYNSIRSYELGNEILKRTICANPLSLLEFANDKASMRAFAKSCVPIIPYIHFTGKLLPQVKFSCGTDDDFILQDVCSSGGHGTYHMNTSECKKHIAKGSEFASYILSPFLKNAVPINVHVVIFPEKSLILPPSYQLIQQRNQTFAYLGGDFHTDFSQKNYDQIYTYSTALAEKLRDAGFRGVCGIDYMLTESEVYFLEFNTRFQASSPLLNKLLYEEGKPSLHQLNLMAFSGEQPPFDSFMQFQKPKAFFSVFASHLPEWIENADSSLPPVISSIALDGLTPEMKIDPGAYLCRAVSTRNLCWRNPDFHLQIAPNIQSDSPEWRAKILSLDPLYLKIGLLNQGIRFSEDALQQLKKCGSVREGVFQAVDLFLENGLIVNAPCYTIFSGISPYCVRWDGEKNVLTYEDTDLCTVHFDPADPFQNQIASRGTVFRHAANWITDRLRVRHQFHCVFKEEGIGCQFCATKKKQGTFSLEDVCEVIDYYLEHTDFRHFMIGGSSGNYDNEPQNIIYLAKHIRSKSNKSIYAMCLPPREPSVLKQYYNAGINEIGFNLELFDREIAKKIMPGKGNIPLAQYEAAYLEAVRLWGRSGAVRSLLILGLEPLESFYRGVEWLCQHGVMPIISVYRPVDHNSLKVALPLSNEELLTIFHHASAITERYGLMLGPSCIACQNNTLSLPASLLRNR